MRDFRRYLKSAGMTNGQFQQRVYLNAIARKLVGRLMSPKTDVAPGEVRRFYRRHHHEFRVPRTRDLRVVIARSRARAFRAKARLTIGQPWGAVAEEFGVDATKRADGHISVDTANAIPELRSAVFAARSARITGPLEVRGSWWVFRIERERPARQLSLVEAAPRIRTSIRSTREQLAFDRLSAYLTRRYRPNTVCHEGFAAWECRNREVPDGGP